MKRVFSFFALLIISLPVRAETILYDFYADWCGPCRSMAPVISSLEARGVPVRRVNVDREPDLAKRFGIQYLPTFVVVTDGKEVARHVGPASESQLLAMLQQAAPGQESRNTAPPKQLRESSGVSPDELLSYSVRMFREEGSARYYGSGTIIYCDGSYALVLTCAHLFSSRQGLRQPVKVEWFGQEPPAVFEGILVARDRTSDLAIVRVPVDRMLPVAQVAGPDERFRPGTRLFSVGCDRGSRPRVYPTYLTAIDRYQGPPNFEIAGAPRQGRSGGGLFTTDGKLVGVCSAADPYGNRGLFTALGAVHQLLAAADLEHLYLQPVQPDPGRPLDDGVPPIQFASNDPQLPEEPLNLPDPEALGVPAAAPASGTRVASQSPKPDLPAPQTEGEAEIVCVIRPLGGADQSSRVIVLRRASAELVRLLEEHARNSRAELASATRDAFSPAVEVDRTPTGMTGRAVRWRPAANSSTRLLRPQF